MAARLEDERFSDDLLAEMIRWLEAAYPSEGCGLVLEDDEGRWRFLECENLADRYHQVDPETFPRTSRDFYIIDPREFMRAEERGERVALIVHSHPDVGDYFSEEDIAAAVMPRGEADEPLQPVYPGTDYLVVSVRKEKADGATLFRFDDKAQTFLAAGRITKRDLADLFNRKEAEAEPVA